MIHTHTHTRKAKVVSKTQDNQWASGKMGKIPGFQQPFQISITENPIIQVISVI